MRKEILPTRGTVVVPEDALEVRILAAIVRKEVAGLYLPIEGSEIRSWYHVWYDEPPRDGFFRAVLEVGFGPGEEGDMLELLMRRLPIRGRIGVLLDGTGDPYVAFYADDPAGPSLQSGSLHPPLTLRDFAP